MRNLDFVGGARFGNLTRAPALLALVAILVPFSGSAIASERCEIETKYLCQSTEGCAGAAPKVFSVIDWALSTYSRCDSAGCDAYDFVGTQSGAWLNIDVPGRGLVAKFDPLSGAFVEVVTLGELVYVSFGVCAHQP